LEPRTTLGRVSCVVALAVLLAACSRGADDASMTAFAPRAVEFPGGAGSGQPRLAADVDGTPILSWLEPAGDGVALRYARFTAGAFGPPQRVTSGRDLFVNWADMPSVQPIAADVWAAHWLKLVEGSAGAYHVATAVSGDGGRTWSAPVQLNDDAAMAEHGFVELFAWNDAIGAFWLDGRELAEWSFDEPDKLLGTSLRLARLDRTGAVVAREIVDELVCDCCQPDMVMTAAGPVVAYRDRTPDEIRDIVVRRHADGAWGEAVAVAVDGWHIEGCPVNGPVIAAAGDSVVVAWFTAAGNNPRVRFARSSDGARSFMPAVDIDGAGSFGQAGLLLERDGRALVTWWRRAAGGGLDLALRTVGADGALGEVRVLAHSTEAQPVDVPQLIAAGDDALVAWTTLAAGGAVHALLFDRRAL
ncbi:MAG TPA: hypothetical protein VKA43_08610, partial [Gammaproteobacteria bacterium]|nr:hypothetical protein [Gammaproteobacteria bacterium]